MSVNILKDILSCRWIKVSAKPQRANHVVEDFLRLPVFFYNTVGIEPYETDRKPGFWFQLYFVLNCINTLKVLAEELVFMGITFREDEDFLESCIILGYVSFVFVGILKLITVLIKKQKLTRLVRQLESCFPTPSQKDQEEYAVNSYLKRCNIFTRGFGGLLTIMFFAHSLLPIVIYYYQICVIHLPDAKQSLPFFDLCIWEWRESWIFYPTYVLQSIAGYTATCGSISSDLMIFAVVFQITMLYNRLAKVLREFEVRNHSETNGANKDFKALQSLIAQHIQILRINDVMNDVFGVPLLLNFLASSLLVCLVGFQLTIEFSPAYFLKQMLLLVSALVEVYLLCFFSQMLIDASENVSTAVYEMNWTEADTRCRKMLVFLSMRAQKPICLKATIVLDLSVETMSIFLSMSYKFFCAIQTIYN
ncbi:odorant receptor 67a [Drosophila takahashii]|uniref:odorant receptor 67a n=1 Tax=Drosophila takahashii TaxID=29030 RepID=UPI003899116E